jgi:predicted dehydrogenase
MKEFRVAFIGCGNIAGLHADGYKINPQCKIVALADLKADSAKAFAEKHGFSDAEIFTDYKAMLRKIRPDVVSVCLWTGLHAEVVKYCAKAKVPAIHCEKPMAPSWNEAVSMAKAVEKAGIQLTFNHQRRKLPIFVKARSLLRKGAIGKLRRIEAFNPANILDWGTHVVDMCFNMNGDKPAVRVLGQIDARQGGAWFGLPFEKSAIGRITFANGVTAVIQSGENKEMNLGFRLHGTDGEIEILETEPHLRVRAKGQSAWHVEKTTGNLHGVEGNEHIKAVIKDVTDGLSKRKEPELSVKRALRATEVIYAWYESALKRQAVELPLKPGAANYTAVAKAAGVKL